MLEIRYGVGSNPGIGRPTLSGAGRQLSDKMSKGNIGRQIDRLVMTILFSTRPLWDIHKAKIESSEISVVLN